ncbi:hypothetical protein [Comamonas sp.]|uniref:hypothetical protein n=1 Tax=Comamonas sp. TaxID=34028 RepID=UPI0028A09EA7|nr:hypothetical protein [Comamonas sp.]
MQSTRSPKDTSVKLFTSEMVGAPSLTQAAGALIDVLSACLVNGFGMQQASSFTVTAGVGQITVPVATGWERMCVIDVAGCADASYNGEYKLTQVSADGLRVSFPIDAPDGAVLGASITVKLAAAGWLLRFADPATNKAVYMPGTPQWAGHCLWVEDVAGSHANVRGYESMTSVDDGLGMFPQVAKLAVATWPKATSTVRPSRWLFLAGDRLLYAGIAAGYAGNTSNVAYMMRWFGRFEPLTPGDMHAITLSVQSTTSVTGGSIGSGCASVSEVTMQELISTARTPDGMTTAISGAVTLLYPYSSESGGDATCGNATGLDVGSLVFAQKFLRHAATNYPRARMPAILHAMHSSVYSVVSEGAQVSLQGRAHKIFPGPQRTSGGMTGLWLCAIDVEGPWT